MPHAKQRIKIEINTRESFSVFPYLEKEFLVQSAWFEKNTFVRSYQFEELLGTKLRALYQRKKGRDLFDIGIALKHFPLLNITQILECFERYMEFSAKKISRAEFEKNLHGKINDADFIQDIIPLLPHTVEGAYDPIIASRDLQEKIVNSLPGKPWKKNIK